MIDQVSWTDAEVREICNLKFMGISCYAGVQCASLELARKHPLLSQLVTGFNACVEMDMDERCWKIYPDLRYNASEIWDLTSSSISLRTGTTRAKPISKTSFSGPKMGNSIFSTKHEAPRIVAERWDDLVQKKWMCAACEEDNDGEQTQCHLCEVHRDQ